MTTLGLVERAQELLNVAGPTLPSGHRHWQEARIHLSAAQRELQQAVDAWRASRAALPPPAPAPPRPR